MNYSTFSLLSNAEPRAVPANLLTETTKEQLDQFLADYPRHLSEMLEITFDFQGAVQFSSVHQRHIHIAIPSLNVDMHLPLRMAPSTLNDILALACLRSDFQETLNRYGVRRQELIAAQSEPVTVTVAVPEDQPASTALEPEVETAPVVQDIQLVGGGHGNE